MHEDIFLLWEHNALTCHFNIMRYFALSLLPFAVFRRDMLLLLMAPQTCTYLLAILKLSEYTYHDISHSVCAKHDYGVDC